MKKFLSALVLGLFVKIFVLGIAVSIASAETFPDVTSTHKNFVAVEYLVNIGTIKGYYDGTYKPDQTLNRAELMKILVAGQQIDPDENIYENCFPDVTTDWYAEFVCYAKEKGWVEGYPDGTFQPAKEVNRVEAVKMMVNALGYQSHIPETVTEELYDDTDSSQWYAPYLYVAQEFNLIEELNGKYYPVDGMKREVIAEDIFRGLVVKDADFQVYATPLRDEFLTEGGMEDLLEEAEACDETNQDDPNCEEQSSGNGSESEEDGESSEGNETSNQENQESDSTDDEDDFDSDSEDSEGDGWSSVFYQYIEEWIEEDLGDPTLEWDEDKYWEGGARIYELTDYPSGDVFYEASNWYGTFVQTGTDLYLSEVSLNASQRGKIGDDAWAGNGSFQTVLSKPEYAGSLIENESGEIEFSVSFFDGEANTFSFETYHSIEMVPGTEIRVVPLNVNVYGYYDPWTCDGEGQEPGNPCGYTLDPQTGAMRVYFSDRAQTEEQTKYRVVELFLVPTSQDIPMDDPGLLDEIDEFTEWWNETALGDYNLWANDWTVREYDSDTLEWINTVTPDEIEQDYPFYEEDDS